MGVRRGWQGWCLGPDLALGPRPAGRVQAVCGIGLRTTPEQFRDGLYTPARAAGWTWELGARSSIRAGSEERGVVLGFRHGVMVRYWG